MAHRYRIPLEQALDLWYEYTARFIRSPKVSRVSIVDYDHLCRDPIFELSRLMADLGQPLPDSEIRDRLGDFLNPELNHRPLDPAAAPPLPPAIQALYVEIKTLRRHRSPRSMPVQ